MRGPLRPAANGVAAGGLAVLVLVVAVLAFYADRRWKTRRSRVSPLTEYDDPASGFVISEEVARLKDEAGVRAAVSCVVEVTSEARSATVLGSTGHPVLCLHFGLVMQRLRNAADGADDPEFRAVLLHEFAHIRYGDVSAARGTMAVWRAFVLVALLPYLIICGVLVTKEIVPQGLNGINPVGARDADHACARCPRVPGAVRRAAQPGDLRRSRGRPQRRGQAVLADGRNRCRLRGEDGRPAGSPGCGATTRAGICAPCRWTIPTRCSWCRRCRCSWPVWPPR